MECSRRLTAHRGGYLTFPSVVRQLCRYDFNELSTRTRPGPGNGDASSIVAIGRFLSRASGTLQPAARVAHFQSAEN